MSVELLAFASAFALVLAVELPDKTMVATLVLTTRFRALPVFVGVAVAYAVHVVVAVLFGSALTLLPEALVAAVVATLFAFGAYLLLREGFVTVTTGPEDAARMGPAPVPFLRSALTSFGVLFAAEWGDASQLAAAGLTARSGQPVAVGLGTFLAMVTVTTVAVVIGSKIRGRLRPQLLHRVAGFAFAGFALLATVQAFTG
jgi:Ca2+/H+ antiporter, TMEM165/GDT1 family